MPWYTYERDARPPEPPTQGDFRWPFAVLCWLVSIASFVGAFIALFMGAVSWAIGGVVLGFIAVGLTRLAGR